MEQQRQQLQTQQQWSPMQGDAIPAPVTPGRQRQQQQAELQQHHAQGQQTRSEKLAAFRTTAAAPGVAQATMRHGKKQHRGVQSRLDQPLQQQQQQQLKQRTQKVVDLQPLPPATQKMFSLEFSPPAAKTVGAGETREGRERAERARQRLLAAHQHDMAGNTAAVQQQQQHQQQVQQLQQQVAHHRQAAQAAEEAQCAAVQDLTALAEQKGQLECSLEEASRALKTVQSEQRTAAQQLDALAKEREELQARITALDVRKREEEERNSQDVSEKSALIDKLQAKTAEREEEIQRLQTQLRTRSAEKQKRIDSLQEETAHLANLQEQVCNLEQQLQAEVQQRETQTEAQAAALRVEQQRVQEAADAHESALAELARQQDELAKARSALEEARSSAKAQADEVQHTAAQLHAATHKDIAEMSCQTDPCGPTLREQELQDTADELQRALEEAQAEIAHRGAELEEMQSAFVQYQEEKVEQAREREEERAAEARQWHDKHEATVQQLKALEKDKHTVEQSVQSQVQAAVQRALCDAHSDKETALMESRAAHNAREQELLAQLEQLRVEHKQGLDFAAHAERQVAALEATRKELHNRVLQLQGNIRVFARVRPALCGAGLAASSRDPNSTHTSSASRSHSENSTTVSFTFPTEQRPDDRQTLEVHENTSAASRGGLSAKCRSSKFVFDRVFAPETTQEDIYKEVEPLCQSMIDGYPVTFFAYGQTGSGKTFTMLGERSAITTNRWSSMGLEERRRELQRQRKIRQQQEQEEEDKAATVADENDDNNGGDNDAITAVETEEELQASLARECFSLDSTGTGSGSCQDTVSTLSLDSAILTLNTSSATEQQAPVSPPEDSSTMGGENVGIMSRSAQFIFSKLAEMREKEGWQFHARTSVVEIYNDQLQDLLHGQSHVTLRRNRSGNTYVEGLSSVDVSSARAWVRVVEESLERRCTKATLMNADSSRSHLVVTLEITMEHAESKGTRTASLRLIDLAGCERVRRTGSLENAELLKEAQHINKSLHALGNVISALVNKASHVPFRDSALCSFLQPTLTGDAKVLMFCNVAPETESVSESLAALRFARKVNGFETVSNNAVPNTATNTTAPIVDAVDEENAGSAAATAEARGAKIRANARRGSRGPSNKPTTTISSTAKTTTARTRLPR